MTFAATGAFIMAALPETIAGWTALAGATVGAVGAISSGRSQQQAANYNATIQSQRADVIREQGAVNEDAQRRRASMALGREAAAMADSGTGLEGTNADVYKQSATGAEIDALNIRYGAKIGGLSADEQAQLDRMQGSNAMTAGYFNAGAAALTSAGNYFSTGRLRGGYSNLG